MVRNKFEDIKRLPRSSLINCHTKQKKLSEKKIDCVLSEKTGCSRQKGCTAFKIWIACDQFQFASERVVIVLEKRKFATL